MPNEKPCNKILTIPNLISLSRLLMLPVYTLLFCFGRTENARLWACTLLIISCMSDFMDGYIARKYHCISVLGKILDPVADKCTQLVMLICVCTRYRQMLSVVVFFVIKESLQLFAGVYYLRRGKMLCGALAAGKLSTVILFASIIYLSISQEDIIAHILFIRNICMLGLLVSFAAYGHVYLFKPNTLSA